MIKKNKSSQFKGQRLSSRGFSLVEVLVAMFIFSLVGVMLSGSFAGFLKTYASAKKAQKSAESAQYAMNLMAKTIRSSVLNASSLLTSGQISMFDNSQGKCVVYKYDTNKIKVAYPTSGATKIDDCLAPVAADFSDLTSAGDVAGLQFEGTPSSGSTVGKIIISMKVQDTASTHLQTTVSLRDAEALSGQVPVTCPTASAPNFNGSCVGLTANSVDLAVGCNFRHYFQISPNIDHVSSYTCQADGSWSLEYDHDDGVNTFPYDDWTSNCGGADSGGSC